MFVCSIWGLYLLVAYVVCEGVLLCMCGVYMWCCMKCMCDMCI